MRTASTMNILYVEDNPADADLLREAIAAAEADVVLHVVDNGVQAYDYLRHASVETPTPDLVLLDWNLPLIPGAAVLTEVRRDPIWSRLRVVVYTSSRYPKDRAYAESLQAKFETKPSTWAEAVAFAGRLNAYASGRDDARSG